MTTKPARAVDLPLAHLYEDGVFYPDEDGVPLPDGYTQSPLMYDAVAPLNAHFAGRPNTAVSGNTFIYYERSNPQRSISPDCYVAFDVDVAIILYHNTYRVWAVGKPPDFALEIASESTAGRDLNAKRVLYAQIGIGEYWRYDATDDSEFYGEPLVGEHLVNGAYQRLPVAPDGEGRPRGHSPMLGLDLVWDNGRLRFYDPATGEWLRSYDEERMAREVAEDRADEERTAREVAEDRADSARAAREAAQARAEAAEAEIQRLREQLRQLQEPQ